MREGGLECVRGGQRECESVFIGVCKRVDCGTSSSGPK